MARIVGGSPMGELRGKLGSSVFSRNASGAYVRSYVVPVNPNSALQNQARNSFTSAVNNYHSLDSSLKNGWDEYAVTSENFSSGFNAYVSANQRINSLALSSLLLFEGDSDETFERSVWQNVSNPPPGDFVSMFNVLTATASIGAPVMGERAFSYNIGMQERGAGPDGDKFNPEFTHQGFALYISDIQSQPGMYFSNPKILIGSALPVVGITAGTTSSSTVTISGDTSVLESSKNNPTSGGFTRMTLFAVDVYGRSFEVSSQEVEVPAAIV